MRCSVTLFNFCFLARSKKLVFFLFFVAFTEKLFNKGWKHNLFSDIEGVGKILLLWKEAKRRNVNRTTASCSSVSIMVQRRGCSDVIKRSGECHTLPYYCTCLTYMPTSCSKYMCFLFGIWFFFSYAVWHSCRGVLDHWNLSFYKTSRGKGSEASFWCVDWKSEFKNPSVQYMDWEQRSELGICIYSVCDVYN